MRTAIVNLGCIVSENWHGPFIRGDAILMEDGRIVATGSVGAREMESADLICRQDDVHSRPDRFAVHLTFGDYAPRQRTVGYLFAWRSHPRLSASKIHVPGRPSDVQARPNRRATPY